MASGPDTPKRDPRLKKARDNARLRKRAVNGSDKASRKNAPKIRAMGNRHTRRKLKVDVLEAETFDESADQANLLHQRKETHWGSDNAAQMRGEKAARRKRYQELGGRHEARRQEMQALMETTKNEAALRTFQKTLAALARQKTSD